MGIECFSLRRKETPVHTTIKVARDGKARPAGYTIYTPNTDYFDLTLDTRPAIVIANGWTAGRAVMGEVATHLALRGRAAIVFDHHRETDWQEHPEIHKKETLKAVVVDYLDTSGQEGGVDIVGHSEGGINATKYAAEDIESGAGRVNSLTLFAPAGVLELTAPMLICRGLKEIAAAADPRHARHIGKLAMKGPAVRDYVIKNLRLTAAEIWAIASPESHVLPDLQDMDAAGFPVGVIGCDDDKFFPGRELDDAITGTVPFVRMQTNHVDWLVDRRTQDDVYRLQQQFAQTALRPVA